MNAKANVTRFKKQSQNLLRGTKTMKRKPSFRAIIFPDMGSTPTPWENVLTYFRAKAFT
jgi:hypothetical protein